MRGLKTTIVIIGTELQLDKMLDFLFILFAMIALKKIYWVPKQTELALYFGQFVYFWLHFKLVYSFLPLKNETSRALKKVVPI